MKIQDIYDKYIEYLNAVEDGAWSFDPLSLDRGSLYGEFSRDPAKVCASFIGAFENPQYIDQSTLAVARVNASVLRVLVDGLGVKPDYKALVNGLLCADHSSTLGDVTLPGNFGFDVLIIASTLEYMRMDFAPGNNSSACGHCSVNDQGSMQNFSKVVRDFDSVENLSQDVASIEVDPEYLDDGEN